MYTLNRTTTTEMEVTSIRLERDLKDKLKELSGNQGYQALIRDVLWNFVDQKSGHSTPKHHATDVRATVEAIAQREEICALTGTVIKPQEAMLLGFLDGGEMIPLSRTSLAN
jgi:metal-responsive CopG/Arc/MetJ family transcriptional regulator